VVSTTPATYSQYMFNNTGAKPTIGTVQVGSTQNICLAAKRCREAAADAGLALDERSGIARLHGGGRGEGDEGGEDGGELHGCG